MKLSQIPFPRPSLRKFNRIMFLVALIVSFVLMVFQPFGTSSFTHEYKYLILAGYGIVTFLVSMIGFLIVGKIVSKERIENWSILDEVLTLFFVVFLSLVSCYFYMIIVFDSNITLKGFLYFLLISFSIAFIPAIIYLGFLYLKFKTTIRSEFTMVDQESSIVHLTSKSHNEYLTIDRNNILFIQANDNYVTIHFLDQGDVKRRMLRNTLKDIENQLASPIVKCHRSYLVNSNRIQEIFGNMNNSKLVLDGFNGEIPVSRSYVKAFKK